MVEVKKKKMAILCYTQAAKELAEKIKSIKFESDDYEINIAFKPKNTTLWVKEQFETCDVLLFICAMGIAVRHIAPFIKSKLTDPAVVVMDEKGKNVISVLSGHIGGANELTNLLAEKLGANPVITTASDVNDKIAIDVFAVKNGLVITDFEMEKSFAARLVDGDKIGLVCDGEIIGKVPDEFVLLNDINDCIGKLKNCIYISDRKILDNFYGLNVLRLVPKSIILGLGCKRGKAAMEIEKAVLEETDRLGLAKEAIGALASIDLKKDEQGLNIFIERYGLKSSYYNAKELEEVEGDFEKSDFVKSVTGIDNVCERALIKYVSEINPGFVKDNLLLKKKKCDGITLAVAKIDWSVEFE